jgi:hypothetical protein
MIDWLEGNELENIQKEFILAQSRKYSEISLWRPREVEEYSVIPRPRLEEARLA